MNKIKIFLKHNYWIKYKTINMTNIKIKEYTTV